MVSKEELKDLLKELKSESDLRKIGEKARSLLRNVDPKELSLAEQELIQEGVPPEELRRLCEVHLKALSLKEEGSEMGKDHPISILKAEHEAILRNLEALEGIVGKASASKSYGEIEGELKELERITNVLIDAEKHHRREEEALFPPLEERGITGPPRIMRMEHEDMRARKKALKKLLEERAGLEYGDFINRLSELSGYIIPTLRDHIFKENNILYPTALETLEGSAWEIMKGKFNEIGYCCFTPGAEGRVQKLEASHRH